MSEQASDQHKADKFVQKYNDSLSSMMLCPLAWMGNKLDLFTHLASKDEMNYEELATCSGCNQRYIQEWLHAMTCAKWIEYNESTEKFRLPDEHKPFLVRGYSPQSFQGDALNAVHIFNVVSEKYLTVFKNGGGLHLDEIHPDIGLAVEAMTGNTQKYHVVKVIESFLPDIHKRLNKGITVADVGCGVGHAVLAMAKKYPNSTFFGFEPHKASHLRAQANYLENGSPKNVTFVCDTSAGMRENEFDFITTWDVVHDLSDPLSFLSDIYKALKNVPESVFLMNEITASSKLTDNLNEGYTFAYALSLMYCTTVSMADSGPAYGACMGEIVPEELCKQARFSSFEMIPNCPLRLYVVKK